MKKKDKLTQTLINASENIPYYKRYFNNSTVKEINVFPIIEKKEILDNYEDFVSDLVTYEDTFVTRTSGSTGMPFPVIHSLNEQEILFGNLIKILNQRNILLENLKMVILCGKEVEPDIQVSEEKPYIKKFYINLTSTSKLDDYIPRLEEYKPTVLSGHASELLIFHEKFGEENNIIFNNLKLILCGGEQLTPKTRERLKEIYSCEVIDNYGMQEIGDIATQCPVFPEYYHIYENDIYLEIKNENNEISDENMNGEFILTNLNNKYMPLIRYKTGDTGRLANSCPCGYQGKCIVSLQGRMINPIYSINKKPFNPYKLKRFFEKEKIISYQIIQNKLGFLEIKIVESLDNKKSLQEFKEIIMSFFDDEIIIDITFNKIEDLQDKNKKIKTFQCNIN